MQHGKFATSYAVLQTSLSRVRGTGSAALQPKQATCIPMAQSAALPVFLFFVGDTVH
jgi:hypothetical protein